MVLFLEFLNPHHISRIINEYVLHLITISHIKAHFDAPGAPQVESLDILATGMTRKSAALLFYQTCGIYP